jgi:hypothetical protein
VGAYAALGLVFLVYSSMPNRVPTITQGILINVVLVILDANVCRLPFFGDSFQIDSLGFRSYGCMYMVDSC